MRITDNLFLTCENNMEMYSRFDDKSIDLACEDPPYFSGPEKRQFYGSNVSATKVKRVNYPVENTWHIPTKEWFDELKRISKNQIIWGANYFDFIGTPFKTPRGNEINDFIKKNPRGWIVWDKLNGKNTFNDYELAWTSFDRPTVIYKFMWNGMIQGKSMNEGHIMQGNKKLNQKRIHPTEKPIPLYEWTFSNYTIPGDIVCSGHTGSGSDALASLRFNITFHGCDLSDNHYENQLKRIKNILSQQKLLL